MSNAYDVLVIGGGPAGIAAATTAAECGRSAALVESRGRLGGQIWRGLSGDSATRYGTVAANWLERFSKSGAKLVSDATVFAAPSPGVLWAEVSSGAEPPQTVELRYQRLVLATGARELFLPFPGWTLPGVVGPGGLEAMAKEGWPVAGKRVVVAGSGPLVLAAADGLKRHGAKIAAIAEQASMVRLIPFMETLVWYPAKLLQAIALRARLAAVRFHTGCWPIRAEGGDRLQSVTLTTGSRTWTVACDYLACAFGLVPNIELPRMLGCEIADGFVRVDRWQQTSLPDVYAAGELTAIAGADASLVAGQLAGLAAADCRNRATAKLMSQQVAWQCFAGALRQAFYVRDEIKTLADAETIVCRCEDVRHGQLQGHSSWRAAKLATRCGMGPCQGRICGAATSVLYGWTNDSVRPPQIAVRVGALEGPV